MSIKGDPTNQPTREFSLLIGLQDTHGVASSVVEVRDTPAHGRSTALLLCFYPLYVKVTGNNKDEKRKLETIKRNKRGTKTSNESEKYRKL
jgi:hypothetical protein